MIAVRPATEDDLPSILDIYNHAIATTTAVFSYRAHTLEMRREWLLSKQDSNYPVLVADRAGRVAGFATYGPFRAWPAYKYTIEHSVYAAADARRLGVGRALMEALLAQARLQDYHAVIAGIVADNVASLRLHESLGFAEVAHFREVGFKFGRWLDLKFLELILETPAAPIEESLSS
jgi:phosphinothricin acetyltransferase